MPRSTKRGGTSASAEGSRRSGRVVAKRKREDEKRLEKAAEESEAAESEEEESEEPEEWEPEEGDDGSEDEYPPRKKAKKGKAKAKVKAAKPKKATTTKTRAQKNSKGSTSKASSSGGHESALNEAKKQFTPGSLIYVREGGMGDWVAGKVVRVYSIRGTITVNWNPRLDDGKYDENPHADNVRNVQTAEEYLAGLSEGSGSGGRLSDSSRKHRARHARMSSAGIVHDRPSN
ncbi:hypothetical protein FA13DRAFT_1807879 [Coprinellus micaceus]|uniref:Uncharacterized protein n=1 Tax=Coprinellus micaceus TaxID=71717 RepID=A0A4Y7R5B3_COPMI|nr:hypothetical protein FA13DRAFT_1807879 [Coprinellus micaceus]